MTIPAWFLIVCFGIFMAASIFIILQVVRAAKTDDFAAPKGKALPGVLYSLTGAMSPRKKESAYLHFPTYTMGILYHLGIFFSFFWLVLHFFRAGLPQPVIYGSVIVLLVTTLCGIIILIKRIVNAKLRYFSCPDDYFSNVLVSGFLALNAASLLYNPMIPVLFIYSGILFLYIPLGKLRHAIYFVITRIYLGLFYGRRGVWPVDRRKTWQTRKK
ncbi:hypothetical protein ACFL02_06715 [Planctomycetota bacterium]